MLRQALDEQVRQVEDWPKQLPKLSIESAPTINTAVARIRFMIGIRCGLDWRHAEAVNGLDVPADAAASHDGQHSSVRNDLAVATTGLAALPLDPQRALVDGCERC